MTETVPKDRVHENTDYLFDILKGDVLQGALLPEDSEMNGSGCVCGFSWGLGR